MPRILLRRTLLPALSAAVLFGACSSKDNDFFGNPESGGSSAQAGRTATSGNAGTSPTGGKGGAAASGGSGNESGTGVGGTTGGAGMTSAGTGGTNTSAGGSGGSEPVTGGTDASGGTPGSGGEPGGAGMPDDGGMGGGDPGSGGSTAGSGGVGGSGGSTGGAGGSGGSGGTAGTGTSGTGGTGGMPTDCEDDGDCDDDEYCKKETCESEEGHCTPRREQCVGDSAVFEPVCGCDHMTYYNGCVAEREGVNVHESGECTGDERPTCNREDGGEGCSPVRSRAICYRPRNDCEGLSSQTGVCWVLPDECPDEPKTEVYCGGGSGEPECVGLCETLESELAVFRNPGYCPD